jgi:hypothetical protein
LPVGEEAHAFNQFGFGEDCIVGVIAYEFLQCMKEPGKMSGFQQIPEGDYRGE